GARAPAGGGPSAGLARGAAAALAVSPRGPVPALHVHAPRHSVDKKQRESRDFRQMPREVSRRRIEPVEVVAANPSQAITDAGRHHGVTVLGAYADASRSSVLVGSRLAKTVEALPGTVIVAKSSRAIPSVFVDEPAPPIMVSAPDV